MSSSAENHYFVPDVARWPIMGSVGLLVLTVGISILLNGNSIGEYVLYAGLGIMFLMMYLWFRDVVNESENGKYKLWEDRSFRLGMTWFIFSEVMFFAAFFGAMLYAREFSVPWLLGEGTGLETHNQLWPGYTESWPTNGPADKGGSDFHMGPLWLPTINTLILLTSGVTVTWAHHAIKENNRTHIILGLLLTVILGFSFVYLQAEEYIHAYNEGLKMESGIYGSIFYMLTGFHGMHVTLGAVMLLVMLLRAIKGHFTPQRHFAFEAAAWYWHFVDVVWLGLYLFVYII